VTVASSDISDGKTASGRIVFGAKHHIVRAKINANFLISKYFIEIFQRFLG